MTTATPMSGVIAGLMQGGARRVILLSQKIIVKLTHYPTQNPTEKSIYISHQTHVHISEGRTDGQGRGRDRQRQIINTDNGGWRQESQACNEVIC